MKAEAEWWLVDASVQGQCGAERRSGLRQFSFRAILLTFCFCFCKIKIMNARNRHTCVTMWFYH